MATPEPVPITAVTEYLSAVVATLAQAVPGDHATYAAAAVRVRQSAEYLLRFGPVDERQLVREATHLRVAEPVSVALARAQAATS